MPRIPHFFCLVTISIFVLLEILVLYPDYRHSHRDGLDNILIILIGGIPIRHPCRWRSQLAKCKAIRAQDYKMLAVCIDVPFVGSRKSLGHRPQLLELQFLSLLSPATINILSVKPRVN